MAKKKDTSAQKIPDFTAMIRDMMGPFPMEKVAMEEPTKMQSALSEKLSALALDAAEKSTELSTNWTKDALTKMSELTKDKSESADYAKAMIDFSNASAEMAAENLSAFAAVAKKVQTETVELLMAAGKDMSEEMTAAAKKATTDMTATAKDLEKHSSNASEPKQSSVNEMQTIECSQTADSNQKSLHEFLSELTDCQKEEFSVASDYLVHELEEIYEREARINELLGLN